MAETNLNDGPKPIRFLRIAAVMDRTGLAESTIYQHMAQGTFPKSFRIGARQAVWDEREVLAWQEAKLASATKWPDLLQQKRPARVSARNRPRRRSNMPLFNTPAARAAQALGGQRSGRGWIARCPAHDDRTPSLSLADGADGRLLVHCFSGCPPLDVLAVLRRLQLSGNDGRAFSPPCRRRSWGMESTGGTETTGQVRARVAAILRRTVPVAGTLAERYLIGRGLDAGIVDPLALRFLPQTGNYPAAMAALVTDFRDAAKVLGLQITSLTDNGEKIERKFLRGTSPKGGVVRLIEDGEVTNELGLAEGTETGLAVMAAYRQAGRMVRPVWAALSAGNLSSLSVLEGLERLYVYADNDASGIGQRAAEIVAQRWCEAGREAFIALPKAEDWNDAEAA